MNEKIFNMMVRVVLNRVRNGESIDDVINSYELDDEVKARLKLVVLALK